MDFKAQSETLKKLLDLDYEPLAVTFTIEEVPATEGKIQMCRALKQAAEGDSFVINEETSLCPGGSWHCGLVEAPAAEGKRRIQRFLTKGEKLVHSIVAFERMQKLNVPEPTGLADKIIITPLDKTEIRPDLVVFQCNPEQACRLITLDNYWDGIPPKIEMTGALCHTVISYSIMTGCTNVTLGDWTARSHHGFDPEIIFVTVPYERMDNLLAAIPECTAGTAKIEIPEDFQLEQN